MSSTKAQESEVSRILEKGDSLLQEGNFKASLVEYERAVFLTDVYGLQQKAIFKKAMVRKQNSNYPEAIKELKRLGNRNPQDSIFARKAYELAFCQYMAGQYRESLGTIDWHLALLNELHPKSQALLTLKILCHNHLFEYDEARKSIKNLANITKEKSRPYYDILDKYESQAPKYRNPEKAKYLSILPGLGQAYCGEFWEGSVSFLLNASALSFGAWQVYSGYYLTGYIGGVTLLQKFHSGGQHRAEILARQKNKANILNFNQNILEEFQKIQAE